MAAMDWEACATDCRAAPAWLAGTMGCCAELVKGAITLCWEAACAEPWELEPQVDPEHKGTALLTVLMMTLEAPALLPLRSAITLAGVLPEWLATFESSESLHSD